MTEDTPNASQDIPDALHTAGLGQHDELEWYQRKNKLVSHDASDQDMHTATPAILTIPSAPSAPPAERPPPPPASGGGG